MTSIICESPPWREGFSIRQNHELLSAGTPSALFRRCVQYGYWKVQVTRVDRIPRSASGKFRASRTWEKIGHDKLTRHE